MTSAPVRKFGLPVLPVPPVLLALLTSAVFGVACGPEPVNEGAAEDIVEMKQSAVNTFVGQKPTYGAIFVESSDTGTLSGQGMSSGSLQNFMSVQATSGRHIASLTSAVLYGVVLYNAVVQTGVVAQKLTLGRTKAQLQADQTTMSQQGYIPFYMSANMVAGQALYNMVWNKANNNPPQLLLEKSALDFGISVPSLASQGYKLISMATTVVNGSPLYSGTMIANQSFGATEVFLDRSATDFPALVNTQYVSNRKAMYVMNSYVLNGKVFYNSAWGNSLIHEAFVWNRTGPEFTKDILNNAAAGRTLMEVNADHVERLSFDNMSSALKVAWGTNSTTIGFAATLLNGTTRTDAVSGLRRTAADPPQRNANAQVRAQTASVTKTLTATAVLQLLAQRGIGVRTSVNAYLPSDWVRGPNFGTITFHELLTHTSGIRGANPDAVSYANLKQLVADGINPGNKVASYQNQNFALFRIIIPYLNGFNESGVSDKDTATANLYLNYMSTKVFVPAGLQAASMKPDATEPTKSYALVPTAGNDWGDWTKSSGGSGLQMSSYEIAKFLVELKKGTLLASSWVSMMDTNKYGWQDVLPVPLARHGTVSFHGGFLQQSVSGGNIQLNTAAVSFSDGTQVGVSINSDVKGSIEPYQAVVDAYNVSWMPLAE